MKSAKLENRVLFYSPSVQAGWEKESHRLDFDFISELGKGSFGVVYKVMHKKTKRVYAIKQIRKKTLNNPKLVEQVKTEVRTMYSLNSPHVIKLFNHFEDQISIYLVIEFAAKGQLYGLMRSQPQRRLNEKVASEYVRQVTQGIHQIHKQNIMHRDIKPENILITDNDLLKVADFGLSHFFDIEDRSTYCGTLDYIAPQMLQKGHRHDYRVDIWSIGVLIYEPCTGQSPFSAQLMKTNTLSEERVKVNIKMIRYELPEYLSEECKNLIRKILVPSADQRPSTEQILSHPWISKTKLNQIQKQRKDWLDTLKTQMKTMFPEEPLLGQNSKQFCFSNDQIYNYTRPDSILNLRPLKPKKKVIEKQPEEQIYQISIKPNLVRENSNDSKRIIQLEAQLRFFQKQHFEDQNEIKLLRGQIQGYKGHKDWEGEMKKMVQQNMRQKNEIQALNWRLAESEKKVLMYQRKQFGF